MCYGNLQGSSLNTFLFISKARQVYLMLSVNFLNFLLQSLETVGSKEEVLNLLVRRTEQCKKLESKISGTHTSKVHRISIVPVEWDFFLDTCLL